MKEEKTASWKEPVKETVNVEFLKRTDLGINKEFLRGETSELPKKQAGNLKKQGFVKFI